MPTSIHNGTLNIAATPGAIISIDGVEQGVAPLSLSLVPGTYTVKAELAGYVTQTRIKPVAADAITEATFVLAEVTNQTCYEHLQDMPLTCAGTVTLDENGGCRSIICLSDAGSLKVLACDKGGFFEMYRQDQTGAGVEYICLGETCIRDGGYAKSPAFPLCG